MSDEVNILSAQEKHGIVGIINTSDYTILHKSELQLIKLKDDTFGVFTAWLDKMGSIAVGTALKALFDGNSDKLPWVIVLILGGTFVILGQYTSYKRNKNINDVLQKRS